MQHAVALYDSRTLRAVETAARSQGDDGLMQRAGQAAWRHLLRHWPEAQRILIVCGSGNNGGDGYALAALAQDSGRVVEVIRLDAPHADDARRACAGYTAAGGRCATFEGALADADVLVDALFGIGLRQAPDAASAGLIDAIGRHGAPVLSLDVPSGVDADTGHVPGAAVHARSTVQFIAAHCGLATGAALDHCGDVDVAPIGVDCADHAPVAWAIRDPMQLHRVLPPRTPDSHKGRNGHVLCIGGDEGHGGAIILASEAALRVGAGLVSVATRAVHVGALLARRPEAMVVAAESAAKLRGLLDAADTVAVGPGLGTRSWGKRQLDAALRSGKRLVIDADGLNLLAAMPVRALHPDTILTPHPGEAARLLGTRAASIQDDRFAAATALVDRYRCVVVLKGAGTIVVAPGRTPRVIAAGNPGMAVGGMGDLLTGVIAALRAQGLDAFDAAWSGALLHALAGDRAARDGGQRGLLPSDLFPQLRTLANPVRAS
jgi:ADP-dependent NAD(P)H-hydrate dehydratase / NAD(P)H-hydrate epimerase